MTTPKNMSPEQRSEYIQKRRERQKTPEFKARRNERLRARYAEDEAYRKTRRENQKIYMQDVVAKDENLSAKYRDRKNEHVRQKFKTDAEYRKRRCTYTVARKKNIRTQAEYDAFMASLEKEEVDDSNIS